VLVANIKDFRKKEWWWDGRFSGLSEAEMQLTSPLEACARVSENLCDKALNLVERGGSFLEYVYISPDMISRLAAHFGVECTERACEEFARISEYESKRGAEFNPDIAAKQKIASEQLRSISDRFLMPSYRKMQNSPLNLRNSTSQPSISQA